MGNTINAESAPLTASPPNRTNYPNKPVGTQTMVMEIPSGNFNAKELQAQHVNINRGTGIPCPICKRIDCGKR